MLEKIMNISKKIDFDKINCFELVKCVFNLNNTDLKILQTFNEDEGITINELSKKIGKDRSITYRSLEKLQSCQICYKERKSGTPRGFVDYYYRIPLKEIFKKAEKNLDSCYAKIKKIISEIDEISV